VKQVVAEVAAKAAGDKGLTIEEVTKRETADGLEARSVSARIRTVDDLLRHIEADMERFEVAQSEATKWEGLTADRETGQPVVTELHRVHVRLKPRGGPTTRECVEAMIEAAKADIRKPIKPRPRYTKPTDQWAVLVLADPHFGKYSWRRTAGADYDLDIAARLVREASAELLDTATRYRPGRLTVATLGDVYHYDSPAGTTTKGTPLERDGRLQKMLNVGTDSLLAMIDAAGTVAPVDTLVVNGNHDETLTYGFQRILVERFRNDRRVRVEQEYTPRKYLDHGKNLLGFAHGHKAKRKLPQLMAIEAARYWAKCPYREIHTGHLHHQAAEWSRPIETYDGVLVRVAPALCPPDDFHAVEGFVGNRQAMELFVYDAGGGLTAMHVAGPRMEA
jgi:metallophosphoesterase superfamily enzyme